MKTLKQYTIFSLLATTMLLAACSDDDQKPEDIKPKEESITLTSGTPAAIGTQGGTTILQFTSTGDWTAESDQTTWCTVSPANGKAGQGSVTVTTKENESTDERNAVITLRTGNQSQRVTITQKQKDALTLTSNRIETEAAGGEISVEVKANVSVEYNIDEAARPWIETASTRGMTTSTLKFTVKENEELQSREGKIYITSNEGLSETVTVYQAGSDPVLVLTQKEYIVGSKATDIVIEVKSNTEYEMELPASADWLTENTTRALSTYTRYISISANEDYDNRTAEIRFTCKGTDLEEVVTITQMQKNAILVAQNEYEVKAVGQILAFDVNTNVEDFGVELSADWIERMPDTRGLKVVPLRFLVTPNESNEAREALIILSKEEVRQEIKVIQAGRMDGSVVRITHINQTFQAPLITGSNLTGGSIQWGDGTVTPYDEDQLPVHTYEDQQEHTVTIESYGAEDIRLENIVGVTKIDLSGF